MLPYQNIFFLMTLAVPAFIFILQLAKREIIRKAIKSAFWVVVVVIFGYWSYIVYLQYQAFASGPLGTTLGTIDGLQWFFGYTRLHFWNQHLVSFIAALGIFALAKYLNKKRGEIFMEPEEIYLGGLGVFLVGYPGFLFYLPLVLIASIVVSLMFVRRGERLPLYHFWMPTAIVVLLVIQFWADGQDWWATFRF